MTIDPAPQTQETRATALLRSAYAPFEPLATRLSTMEAQLNKAAAATEGPVANEARRLRKLLREFQPGVTMIGQVKAGKTTLVNALSGWPGLLPADVNPWTSVVTSLNMTPERAAGQTRAAFRFFDEAEWGHLLNRGGRVGELAHRAGADSEVETVRRQLEEMREKSRQRLGNRFELLLGQSHDFDSFDRDLIERYVCLGDDFWEETGASPDQGRFADITRSADLWFGRPELPMPLCLRDTPGVNDTFMIREQITIRALRGSRLCVMVLSAHQALSTVDLALIRLIANVKARDLVIFVNRIDELADPASEIPQIRESIAGTLRRHDGPADAEVIFGSGFWANHALKGSYDSLGEGSAKALLSYAEARVTGSEARESVDSLIWRLSGVPELCAALARRVEAGAGAALEAQIAVGQRNLDRSAEASRRLELRRRETAAPPPMADAERQRQLASLERALLDRFEAQLGAARATFRQRLEKARQTFLGRATTALLEHLEAYGELTVWTYDPKGLRVLLRTGYHVHVRAASGIAETCLAEAATALSRLYDTAFDLAGEVALEPPPLPAAPPPVSLGQTIALDLRGSWWRRFWTARRGFGAYASDFTRLIHEETEPIVDSLIRDTADVFEISLRDTLRDFVASQSAIMETLAREGRADLPETQAEAAPERRLRVARGSRPQPLPGSFERRNLEVSR